VRPSSDRRLGIRAAAQALALTDAQRRIVAALLRHELIPRAWQKKAEAELLRGTDDAGLGAVLAAVYASAPDKGQRAGIVAWELLRQRGASGLTADFERLLRDEPLKLRSIELGEAETRVVFAVGRKTRAHDLGASDHPLDLVRAVNRELESAGVPKRFHLLQSAAPQHVFLLCDPVRVAKMKRGGLSGIGKVID
jgi:hypothetical protein